MRIDRRTFIQSAAALATLSAVGCASVEKAPQPMAKASMNTAQAIRPYRRIRLSSNWNWLSYLT